MAVAVIGLLLTILALWLSVEDRPTVSFGPQQDPRNVLSVTASVVNNGILPIRNVVMEGYLKQADDNRHNRVTDAGTQDPLRIGILRVGEPAYFALSRLISDNGLTQVDGAVVAHFSPIWAPFWKRHRFFRFAVAKQGDTLQQIPSENIEDDFWAFKKHIEELKRESGRP